MIFMEEYLLETTFANKRNLEKHYKDHVLEIGERFNPDNPKFPHMSMEQYDFLADELSNEKAGLSTDRDPSTHVIGFVLKDGRSVKFRKRSQFYPRERFSELVIYVDDELRGHETISYMLGRPGKIFRMLQQYQSELPENEAQVVDNSVVEMLSKIVD